MAFSNLAPRFQYWLVLFAAFFAGVLVHSLLVAGPTDHDYFRGMMGKPQSVQEERLSTSVSTATAAAPTHEAQLPPPQEETPGYTSDKWFFQADVDLTLPTFDVLRLRKYAPRNYKGTGNPAFATFYLSRNASMQDPYFIATMQVVYRLLWAQTTRSNRYPVVVFVAPHILDEQRAYLEAAGAMVREVASRPFTPNEDTKSPVAERLKDVFSKLEMWNQTDFSRIAYLDSDAFPLLNVDMLLTGDMVPDQECRSELLSDSDGEAICDYAFGAVHEMTGMMNAGVMVLKPNTDMYEHLIAEYHDGKHFDNGFVEQALLSYVFRQDGPFPPTMMEESWNGSPEVKDQGGLLFILHAKIWALFFKVDHWASSIWGDTWNELVELYEDKAFERLREKDDRAAKPHKADLSKWGLEGDV